MKMSKFYMPTLREVPSDAEIPSHKLLLRAGMIRKNVSGIYSYLPLGYKVVRKVEKVVREEMDASGSLECLLSAVQPKEIWEESGRWDNFGPEMFKLNDRHLREFCLGPTHEEYFTTMIKDEIKSYKQLPLNLYQIQTKYRDEKRPRFGVIRAREFIMKDAYSFDTDVKGMEESYQEMWDAYDRIFTRLKMKYSVVQGDSGAMGGSISHEFVALSDVGEGLIAYCNDCDYAATDEKATVVYKNVNSDEEMLNMEKIETPGVGTIDELHKFLNVDKSRLAKSVMYEKEDGKIIMAIIPGDRQLNETKLFNAAGVNDFEVEVASDETILKATGAHSGSCGPVGLVGEYELYVDSRVAEMRNVVVGGNEDNYHIKNVNYGRDFEGVVVEDLLMVEEGDVCPKCGSPLQLERGIEVGNIFQLGTKYSSSLGPNYLDENGKAQDIYMGSYGVGVTRSVAAIVEQNYDENGIIWPMIVAPYEIIISIVNMKDEDQVALGEKLYNELSGLGYEVLLDDRNERAGVKFKDRDLIGIPIRVTVGKKAAENMVEYSLRKDAEKIDISVDELLEKIKDDYVVL
ncbi:MAG: proline--tRNA ligase [Tissierellia bacterium]|nr:proline--tRNA ligase [Tissierellia bacterium]